MGIFLRISGLLALLCIIGCEDPKPPVTKTAKKAAPKAETATEDPPAQPEPIVDETAKKTTDTPEPESQEVDENSPAKEAELKARLEKNPKDADAMLGLAKLTQYAGNAPLGGEPNYDMLKKSSEYLERALETDPKVVEKAVFQEIAARVFYNGACALSREKQPDAALKALSLAIEHGWWDIKQIKVDADLANLRSDKGFEKFMEHWREARRKSVAPEVEALFKDSQRFKFDFDLTDTEGKPLKKDDFAGKLLMVNVWGTWCGPCRAEIPDLAAAYTKYKSQGFEIVGLNTESEEGDKAIALIKENQKSLGINYRCALGNDKLFGQIPDYGAVPTSLFMDRKGKVRAMLVGAVDDVMLESIIERLIQEAPAEDSK